MQNPMFMLILIWLGCGLALVLAFFKIRHKQWGAAVLLMVIGVSVILATVLSLRLLNRIEVPLPAADSVAADAGGRIVMQVPGSALIDTLYWAFGFLISAIALVQFPDILWKKWLSYPAALGALLLVGLMILITIGQKLERIVADSNGIEVLTETRGISVSENKVAWKQVGAVKRVEVYMKKKMQNGGDTLERREFVLMDQNGQELLNIEEPLDPPDRYKLFLESIPRWTDLQVREEKKRI
jgi:hypothetical protein